jgi:pyruvate,water dikinase
MVPGWFAVTDAAFRAALAAPIDGGIAAPATGAPATTLGEAIASLLADPAMAPDAAAEAIRRLWLSATLPGDVARAVTEAYRALGPGCEVAIRSSSFEEDTAHATRAGLFETRLAVRGEAAVLQQLAEVWAGMWSARALHDRARRRDAAAFPGGGVLVQRMVRSRISGVAQTTNVAQSRPCELVINVGLGLGEGIVRGAVAADHVVVAKDSVRDAALRFRYITADKRTRIVADERFGAGTTMVGTLAHQRLRPALEYPELVELASVAVRLEQAYAQPLDIEFAFEDADLRILQVRPVPAAGAVWRETAEKFPFGAADRRVEERP